MNNTAAVNARRMPNGPTKLHEACYDGDLEFVRFLLGKGAAIDIVATVGSIEKSILRVYSPVDAGLLV